MAENIPRRLTAHFAYMYMGIAPIVNSVYTSTTEFTTLPIYGPVRDIEIEAAVDKVDQTAGGDPGHHEIFTRWGLWTIRIAAFQDAAAVFGDSRIGTLNGQYVEFLIVNETGFNICKGLGKAEFRLTMPAAAGETIVRDLTLTRYLGSLTGNLVWADLATGAFP